MPYNLQLLVNIFKYIIDSNLRHSVAVYWTILKSHLYVWWVHNFKEKIMYPRFLCYTECCCVTAWSVHWKEVRWNLFFGRIKVGTDAFRTMSLYWVFARCLDNLAFSWECFGHIFHDCIRYLLGKKVSSDIPLSNIKV